MADRKVCDICGALILPDDRTAIDVEIKGNSVSVAFGFQINDAANPDLCYRCRATALRKAAAVLSPRSTRERPNKKREDNEDNE